ncbi:pre-peptidase C-terminal domain-containing protein [Pseudoalteromonas denitrificans]|uniref:Pre-peptidase C-terminal domain-containing protein n=1 Tax=Pseudoalteromonas denitrificans DSM 6059 TaxID=1123010 RepID=A0A1I1I5J0_9GAMM|nr:pre-peptidase C-terminal domain-containing protein [Pseudoalteromonas denitrificans]SFC31436.1 pre-peptidase C-terminal domain-containing protein [Pseudoalteromonas denitrificans DSM 6059]
MQNNNFISAATQQSCLPVKKIIKSALTLSVLTAISTTSVVAAEHSGPVINDNQAMQMYSGADLMATVAPESFTGDVRDLSEAVQWQPGDPIKSVPRRIYPNALNTFNRSAINPVANTVDPLLGIQSEAEGMFSRAVEVANINQDGMGYTGVNPADPTGTVGKNHYIQSINGGGGALFSIYDKATGNQVSGPTNMSDLATNRCKNGLGDPIVFYDEDAERYVMTEFSNQSGRSLCVYVSKTDNPVSGGWFAYEFQAPEFPDYPKFGRYGDSYYVGTNESAGPGVYALERSKLLSGQTARMQRKTAPRLSNLGFQMMVPVDVDSVSGPAGSEAGIFIRQRDDEVINPGSNNPNKDYIELWTFAPDYDNTSNSQLVGPINIEISEFDAEFCSSNNQDFGCLTQKGTSQTLDPLKEVIMYRAQYRKFSGHESIVGNFLTDVSGNDQGGIRWFELRRTNGGQWGLHQEGTYAPSGTDHRFMGSAAMDASGNIALSYHISGPNTYPGINMTGRNASDANGTMTQAESVLVAGTSHIASDRNGDYSHLSVDPVDNCTFWMTSDYGSNNGKWKTRISNFKFDNCGAPATPDFTMAATNLSQQVCANTALQPIGISTAAINGFSSAISLTYSGLPTGVTGSFTASSVTPGGSSDANVSVGNLNTGDYNFTINGTASGVSAKQLAVALSVVDAPTQVVLSGPASGSVDVALRPEFSWTAHASASSYRIEVATDNAFSNVIASGTVASGTNYQPSADLNTETTYYWRVRADNGCGQVWSEVSSFTTQTVDAGTILQNGIAKTNLSGELNSETTKFTFVVPANVSNLKFVMSGGTGDADMHVKFDQEASTSVYDCRPFETGNDETCTISNIQTGTYHVTLHGYRAYSGVSLVASYSDGTSGGIDETNISGAANSETFYSMDVAPGTSKLTVVMSGGTGDADLYVKEGSQPTETSYNCRPFKNGNSETCTINNPGAGTWHVGVFGYRRFSGVSLKGSTE